VSGAPTAPPSASASRGQESTTARSGQDLVDDRVEDRSEDRSDDRLVGHLATAGEHVAGGRFREAEVEVLRALSGVPADVRALNLLALVRVKLGRLEEARATYREIVAVAPSEAAPRRHLGLLALKLDQIDDAIPELEAAARLAPGDAQTWSYLGYAYAKKGEPVPAAAAFRRAGQDALAVELEHAATARRPASGPKLGALAGAGTPRPAAPPEGLAPVTPSLVAPAAVVTPSLVAPAAVVTPSLVAPGAVVAPAASVASENVEAGAPPVVAAAPAATPAASVDGMAPVELAPVPLLGFVLSRLGMATVPPAPIGEALRLAVDDEAYVRAGVALAAVGVRFEPAFRRTQGRRSSAPLAPAGAPFFRLVGPGDVWVAGSPGRWQAVLLEDDILYVREDRVLAFDGGVSWEAGAVPGDGLRMLQFRGRGCVVLEVDAPPVAIKVTEDRPAFVSRAHLLGWVGRLVTHRQRGLGTSPFDLACQGEGVLLLHGLEMGR
jgi:uncharacterized protein (AIM24 family)